MKPPFPEETIHAWPWNKDYPPRRILVIRLQAMGDCAITLPAINALREQLPSSTKIDLVARQETAAVSSATHIYNKVYALPGGRNGKKIFLWAIIYSLRLLWNRYDVVLDLQRNRQSRILRKWVFPKAWSEIERFSATLAVSKYQEGIKTAGFPIPNLKFDIPLQEPTAGDNLLKAAGWQTHQPLVVLNPAGLDPTRNWPLQHFISFAKLWADRIPEARFVIMGYQGMREKANRISEALPGKVLDLTGNTTVPEAMAILRRAQLMVSEDSGLMHMAWVQGVPTLAIFGASRYDWSRPTGEHSHTLCALDLECIGCLSATCKFEDIPCMNRFSPEQVVKEGITLLTKLGKWS